MHLSSSYSARGASKGGAAANCGIWWGIETQAVLQAANCGMWWGIETEAVLEAANRGMC